MTINLGLSKGQTQKYLDLLTTHHSVGVEIDLMNFHHGFVRNVSSRLLGGQVTIDASATEATRSLTLELLDPKHEFSLDTGASGDGSLYFSNMVRVSYVVMPARRTEQFTIPIFTGPLTKVQRYGPVIAIEALGKEKLALSSVRTSKTYKKNARKTDVIRRILIDLSGEDPKRVDIPDRKAKLPKNLTVARDKKPWEVCRDLARSMDMQLFYDGRGVVRLRNIPKASVFTYREKGALLSLPQVGYDAESAINAVRVIGGKPKGKKKKITHFELPKRNHPMSPHNMGRNGVPRYLIETIEESGIRSKKEAKRRARSVLRSRLIENVEVSFDALPIPHLEELDLCRVISPEFSGSFRMTKMTIPLTADGKSSVGYLRRVTPNKRQIKLRSA